MPSRQPVHHATSGDDRENKKHALDVVAHCRFRNGLSSKGALAESKADR
jgi:hypothetical protein